MKFTVEHTPGPWKFTKNGQIIGNNDNGCIVVNELQVNIYDERPAWNEMISNACLIAAAPDMEDYISLMIRTVNDTLRHGLTEGQTEALEDMCKRGIIILNKIGGKL